MKILGLQKLTLLDYPQKVACTIFLGGCNFKCPFCHNGNLVLGEFPQEFSEEEIFEFLKKRRKMLDGVCITGGEPLLSDSVFEFIRKIRELGYLVKLDTNGSFPERLKKAITEGLVDYVAMDIKNSKKMYPETVGADVNMDDISESVDFLKKGNVDYEFRTTIVKEYHTRESITRMAEWIKGAKRHFLQGFTDSECVIKKGLNECSPQTMQEFAEILKEYVDSVEIRGI